MGRGPVKLLWNRGLVQSCDNEHGVNFMDAARVYSNLISAESGSVRLRESIQPPHVSTVPVSCGSLEHIAMSFRVLPWLTHVTDRIAVASSSPSVLGFCVLPFMHDHRHRN